MIPARLAEICSRLSPSKILADVGCDHGYLSEYALSRGLCGRAYVTDISAGSLKKATRLLQPYIDAGRCIPVLCDGLDGIGETPDLVVIAGMGGEETVKILSRVSLPERFVLQPMHNSDKLRRHLLERGAHICHDYTFESGGYFYDLIAGEGSGGDSYTAREIFFGRDNLRVPTEAFLRKAEEEIGKLRAYLAREMSAGNRQEMTARLAAWQCASSHTGERS